MLDVTKLRTRSTDLALMSALKTQYTELNIYWCRLQSNFDTGLKFIFLYF